MLEPVEHSTHSDHEAHDDHAHGDHEVNLKTQASIVEHCKYRMKCSQAQPKLGVENFKLENPSAVQPLKGNLDQA